MKAYIIEKDIIEKDTCRCLKVNKVMNFDAISTPPMSAFNADFDIKTNFSVTRNRKERKEWRDFLKQTGRPHLATKQELRKILVERGFPIEKLERMTRKQLCRAVMIPANSHLH